MFQAIFSNGHSSGAVIGITEVLMNQRRVRSLVAHTVVEVSLLQADALRELTEEHEGLELRGWQLAGTILAMLHGPSEMRHLDYSELYRIFRNSTLEKVPIAHQVQITGSALLLQGSLEEVVPETEESVVFEGPMMMSPDPAFYTCITDVKILNLPGSWASTVTRPDVHAMMMRQGTRKGAKSHSIFRTTTSVADGTIKRQSTVNSQQCLLDIREHRSSQAGEAMVIGAANTLCSYKSITRRGSIVFKPKMSTVSLCNIRESEDASLQWDGAAKAHYQRGGRQSLIEVPHKEKSKRKAQLQRVSSV